MEFFVQFLEELTMEIWWTILLHPHDVVVAVEYFPFLDFWDVVVWKVCVTECPWMVLLGSVVEEVVVTEVSAEMTEGVKFRAHYYRVGWRRRSNGNSIGLWTLMAD